MASSVKISNANGKIVTIENNDSNMSDVTLNGASITKKVDTLANMRAMGELPETVWCSGYHSKNDGAFGSHFYRLKGLKTTETDNGGTVIVVSVGGVDYVYELQYSGAVNVKWFGAVGDYFDGTGNININPRDNYEVFTLLFNNVDKAVGENIEIPSGSYYCSNTIDIQYTVNNYWSVTNNMGRLTIAGQGKGSTSLYFPSTVQNGITFNKDITVISNYELKGISIIRAGFNQNDYEPRPFIEDFMAEDDILFGAGVWFNRAGYTSSIEDVYISGFYTSLYIQNTYSGDIKNIFTTSKSIYGFYGKNNTTLNIKDSSFKGLQSCFTAVGGVFNIDNIAAEGTSDSFVHDTSLFGRFSGHGFVLTGGYYNLSACYSEKLIGIPRYVTNSSVNETAGVISNTMHEANYSTTIEDLLDIYNPNRATIYVKNTTDRFKYKYTVDSSSVQHYDTIYIDDENATSMYSPIFSIKNSLKTDGGLEATLDKSFPMLRPSEYSLLGNKYDYKSSWGGTFINGIESIAEYSKNTPQLTLKKYSEGFTGNLTPNASLANTTYSYIVNTDGSKDIKGTKVNTSGSETTKRTIYSINSDLLNLTYNANLLASTDFYKLGSPTKPWGALYATNATIQTSDERLKEFSDITDIERQCALELKTHIKKFKWLSKISSEGEDARDHLGVGAQTVVKIFEKYNLDPMLYGICCYDEWEENGEVKNKYSVRYMELVLFIIASL